MGEGQFENELLTLNFFAFHLKTSSNSSFILFRNNSNDRSSFLYLLFSFSFFSSFLYFLEACNLDQINDPLSFFHVKTLLKKKKKRLGNDDLNEYGWTRHPI